MENELRLPVRSLGSAHIQIFREPLQELVREQSAIKELADITHSVVHYTTLLNNSIPFVLLYVYPDDINLDEENFDTIEEDDDDGFGF